MSSILNNNQRKILVYRGYTSNANLSSENWLAPSQFQLSTGNDNVTANTLSLDNPVPISNGTVVDDGTNTLTGASGGSNSTSNIVTYKDGAGVADEEAQNLITNTTSTTKRWSLGSLTFDVEKYLGFWLYIHTNAFDLISDIAIFIMEDDSNYYSYEVTNFTTGWNWISLGTINSLTETGTVTTPTIFRVEIETSLATDSWAEGEVIYDLLRQWEVSDTLKDLSFGYPSVNTDNREVSLRCYINSIEANGFNINALGIWNKDTTKKLTSASVFPNESKSDTDEFLFIEYERGI